MDRRESLALVVGAAASMAGCTWLSGGAGESSPTPTAGEEPIDDGPSAGSETDPETLLVRADTDGLPVWAADPDRDDGDRPTPRRDERRIDAEVVDAPSLADRVTVAEGVDGERVGSFLSSTDFGSEAVYLETFRVEECFRLELCHVAWSADEVSTDYTSRDRPYDERCVADEHVFESRLVRIPDPIDADDVRSYSASVGTGACDRGGRSDAEGGTGLSTDGEPGTATESPPGTPSSTPTGADATDSGGEQ